MQIRALRRAAPSGLRAAAIAAALASPAFTAPARAADPPAGYKDVTTYKSTSWSNSFNPLVPNDPSKATANASNLNKMIAANIVLYFPPGTYWIDKTISIGKAGVTLWGEEGSVICRTGVPNTCETAFPLSSFNDTANFMVTANNFKMHGLTIMYDVPTSFTGVITAKNSNTATVRLTDGKSASFSADVAISRVNYFDENLRPSGNETFFEAGSKLAISNLSEDENGVKSFKCTLKGSSVGQRVAMACGSNYGQNIIIYSASASGVQNTVFEDVTVANSFGMVMLVKGATNLTLERFRVDDGDTNTIYTASVDGIHVAALGGKLTMRDCEFNGLADDILNVHCGGPKVGSVSGTSVTFESAVESVYFQRGHVVRLYSSKLADLGTATVTSVSGSVSGIAVDALPSGVAAGCYVANESWLPEVEITGTKVGVTRARGFLLQTDRPVTIADCTFENTRLAGILCAPGASWGEMGPVNGVTVSNCTFRACGVGEASSTSKPDAAVIVRCDHDKESAGSYAKTANKNVWVEGCFFEDCTASGVSAANLTGLVVTNNVFLRCGGRVATEDSCMVRLRSCDNAKVVFNTAYGGGFTNDVYSVSGNTNVEAHDNGFRDESEWGASPVLPVLATRADDGVEPLGFGVDPSDDSPTFEVTIRNASGGVWYTVYAADAVDGAYAAAASVQAAADGLLTLSVPAPSDKPARFVRIGASKTPVPFGTAL